MPTNKQTYRPKEAAEFLSIGQSTFFRYVQQGLIKTIKYSKGVTIVEHSELERFLRSRMAV